MPKKPVSKHANMPAAAPATKAVGATETPNLTPAAEGGAAADLRLLKLSLMGTREKLLLVSPDLLNDADHAAWSDQIFAVSRAINAVRNAELESLTEEFRRELPAFAAATDRLSDDLFELQQATEVIKAVAGVLGVFTKIIKLM